MKIIYLSISIFFTTIGFSQKLHLMGQVLNDSAYKVMPRKMNTGRKMRLVSNADLSKFCPPPASQPFNNCYAYASVYTARTTLYNITVNESQNPQKNIFSTGFIEYLIFKGSTECKHKGADTHIACELMESMGSLPLEDYPEECTSQSISTVLLTKALAYKIKSKEISLYCADKQSKIDAVKLSLSEMHPVVIGINSVRSFHKNSAETDLWEPTKNERRKINCNSANHAVCVIAFDDSKYGGAFLIQNSWGNTWKRNGRIWIKYSDFSDFMCFAIELSN